MGNLPEFQNRAWKNLTKTRPVVYKQNQYRDVPRWEIFLEQELRFGLDLGQLSLLKKIMSNCWGQFFQVSMVKDPQKNHRSVRTKKWYFLYWLKNIFNRDTSLWDFFIMTLFTNWDPKNRVMYSKSACNFQVKPLISQSESNPIFSCYSCKKKVLWSFFLQGCKKLFLEWVVTFFRHGGIMANIKPLPIIGTVLRCTDYL